jgi:hypothetical protein
VASHFFCSAVMAPEAISARSYVIMARVADCMTLVAYGGLSPDVAEAGRFTRLATDKLRQAPVPSP